MTENGFEYVDLGLPSKTMWATCNVGATKPEDNGLLFQWGHTDGYMYGDENNKFIKGDQIKKYIDNILDLGDNAAHVHMGGKWRMPTKDEIYELISNTTHTEKTIHGVKGMMFISKTNRHKLFIPFMQGWWYNGKWENWDKSSANIWSSQKHDYILYAYNLYCNSSDGVCIYGEDRYYSFSVRGVFKK